jgi:hypothetical protein
MLKSVVTVVQQIMRECNGAVLEEDKIVTITKIVIISWNKMATSVHRHDLLY